MLALEGVVVLQGVLVAEGVFVAEGVLVLAGVVLPWSRAFVSFSRVFPVLLLFWGCLAWLSSLKGCLSSLKGCLALEGVIGWPRRGVRQRRGAWLRSGAWLGLVGVLSIRELDREIDS